MSHPLRSHDATIPLQEVNHQHQHHQRGGFRAIPPNWPMAAKLQRRTTGDGTRQAGGSSRSSQRARAARRSWLPPPGRRPLREGRFRQKRCVGIRGSQKKMGAGCDAHAISFFVFHDSFSQGNRTPSVPGGVLLRIATRAVFWFGRAGLDMMRSLLGVRYGGRLLLGVTSGIHLETQDHMPPGIV